MSTPRHTGDQRRGPVSAHPTTDQRRRPSAMVVIETVLALHGFSPEDIGSPGTIREHQRRALARDEAIYVAAAIHPGLSLDVVAELFMRDVTTILHGQFVFQKRLLSEKALAARVFRMVDAATKRTSGIGRTVGGAQ